MTNEEIAVMLTEHEQKLKVINHRLKDVEENTSALNTLALSVKELATNMSNMQKDQERLSKHIEKLEAKPAKRLESIITVIITAIVSGGVTLILSHLF